MTKDEFIMWKDTAFTQALFKTALERRQDVMEALVAGAGNDPREDAFKAGYCAALVDFIGVDFESLTEE